MTTKLFLSLVSALAAYAVSPSGAGAAGLRGSPSSMRVQHQVAVEEDLTFLANSAQVRTLVKSGKLEVVEGNSDFSLSGVSFPYARPETKLFIERIAAQHRRETGQMLVVTSITRPSALQPRNAHELSVHPAGMAVDFRIPASATSRAWLERALMDLENAKVLDVTRERNPPHYHVAVFPAEYLAYAKARDGGGEAVEPGVGVKFALPAVPIVSPEAKMSAVTVNPEETSLPLPIMLALLLTTVALASTGVLAKVRR